MSEFDILSKVEKLKKIYRTPIDQRELDTVEEKIRQTVVKQKLARRSEVRDIIGDSIRRIKELSYLLAWDEKSTEEERVGYFAERRVHMFWLNRLDGTAAKKVLQYIESNVDNKLDGSI